MVPWWDEARIDDTVTREFVCRHLVPIEIERLDQSLAFGDGLTDGTYWEWIDTKAKRIFLILVDIGVPDQIFGIIDDSWDDHDLPIAQDQIDRLALTAARDDKIDRKFFQRQFHYLMRPLQRGDHVAFTEHELLPLEVVDRRPGLVSNHTVDKVSLPNCPGQAFCRRKIPLGTGFGSLDPEGFQEAVNSIKGIQNQHLVSYYASYTHRGTGYVLFVPGTHSNLKSMFSTIPSAFKNLPKKERRQRIMNWILCLVDALAYIHSRRLSHGNIKPSSVLFTSQLDIFFSDFTRLNAEALAGVPDKSSFDQESYVYAAPEQWFRPHTGPSSPGSRKPATQALAMSTSPQGHTEFSIPRSDNPSSPNAMLHTPNPYLNPQAADVFSLGCVLLEMIGFILKKSTKSFATHRASKNKTAGRGGAVPDSSFHKNLGQVETWMSLLAKEASKKTSNSDGAEVFRGVVPMLQIIASMLSANPNDRPPAWEVQQHMYQILTQHCSIAEPHCAHRYANWDMMASGGAGMPTPSNVRVQSPTWGIGLGPGEHQMAIPIRQDTTDSSSSSQSRQQESSGRTITHSRTNSSSGGLSGISRADSSASSERGVQQSQQQQREPDSVSGTGSTSISGTGFASVRNIRRLSMRSPTSQWQPSSADSMYGGHSDQASVY